MSDTTLIDFSQIMAPWDNRDVERINLYLNEKRQAALHIQPRRILEIGVCCGYSAFAFLHNYPDAYYLGIDAEVYRHGGGSRKHTNWARNILSPYNTEFLICDSQSLKGLFFDKFQLIHIDGEHTYTGCLHDMGLCLSVLDGIMVVDDYHFVPQVKKAVDNFVEKHALVFEEKHTLKGEAWIRP